MLNGQIERKEVSEVVQIVWSTVSYKFHLRVILSGNKLQLQFKTSDSREHIFTFTFFFFVSQKYFATLFSWITLLYQLYVFLYPIFFLLSLSFFVEIILINIHAHMYTLVAREMTRNVPKCRTLKSRTHSALLPAKIDTIAHAA